MADPDRGLIEPAKSRAMPGTAADHAHRRWVVYEACRQARGVQDAGLQPIAGIRQHFRVEFRNKGS